MVVNVPLMGFQTIVGLLSDPCRTAGHFLILTFCQKTFGEILIKYARTFAQKTDAKTRKKQKIFCQDLEV